MVRMKKTSSSSSRHSPLSSDHGQTNYDQMFGHPDFTMVDKWKFLPDILPLTYSPEIVDAAVKQARSSKQWLLLFVIGTKPCFYKFWGSIQAASAAKIPFLIIDSGQHYDTLLTHGLREFGLQQQIALQLNIRGDLAQKSGELTFKMAWLSRYLDQLAPGLVAVPVVLGDTIMTSVVPSAWLFARTEKSIQLEAGLRSMAPDVLKRLAKDRHLSMDTFFKEQRDGHWDILTNEPFPEQYDTYTSAAGSQFLFPPTELNRKHLLREGYPSESIFVTGGVVVDALTLKRKQKPSESIFNVYPKLKQGHWIRVDIHRKENLTPKRFAAIIGAIHILVKKGYCVNFVEMNVTRKALDHYGMRKDLMALTKRDNFLFTPIWPEYAQVIEFYQSERCLAALTDSGGLQEELNILKKVCLTCRFNTDRPETIVDGRSNLLIPPVDAAFVAKAIEFILKNKRLYDSLRSGKVLYGANAGANFTRHLQKLMKSHPRPFQWSHERLGFWTEPPGTSTLL